MIYKYILYIGDIKERRLKILKHRLILFVDEANINFRLYRDGEGNFSVVAKEFLGSMGYDGKKSIHGALSWIPYYWKHRVSNKEIHNQTLVIHTDIYGNEDIPFNDRYTSWKNPTEKFDDKRGAIFIDAEGCLERVAHANIYKNEIFDQYWHRFCLPYLLNRKGYDDKCLDLLFRNEETD